MFNEAKTEARFFLHVHAFSNYEVYPIKIEDKDIEDRLKESFSCDDDWACAGFVVKSMPDLLKLLAFYSGRKVEMTLTFEVHAPEVKTSAFLGDRNPPSYGTYQFLETDKLTPEAAANKLRAIASALVKKTPKTPSNEA